MEYHLKDNAVCSGQRGAILNYGDRIWDEICDKITSDTWHIEDVVDAGLPCLRGMSTVTQRQYIRATLKNIVASPGYEDSSLERLGQQRWAWRRTS
jgi:hypothetical protein